MCGSNVFLRVLWLFLCRAIASCSPLTADRQANITSMLGQQADRVMALGEWEERWQQNKISFHQPEVHKMLKKNIDKVLNGRTGVRFFFPLCGKAVDMKWLADMGHSVVGVEISEKAIRQFFEENNMTYSEEPVPAIPGAKVYAALIISLMANDCRYLLDTLLYNPDLYQGPPFFVPDEQVHSLFGSSCDIELLQSEDALTDKQRNWGLDKFLENVHLITPKSN
ncbi:probable thiopurine S-methyltransferase [Neolamprologus brichardi]|uniref:probable thiopurine S-methyltransferase n=1 Tax=Neolamprologus brichardi TaxID=32507 RepID=UPI0003EBDDB6|nr:probable thiopurine S-methyltransferase [Neolamprologus brichardi]